MWSYVTVCNSMSPYVTLCHHMPPCHEMWTLRQRKVRSKNAHAWNGSTAKTVAIVLNGRSSWKKRVKLKQRHEGSADHPLLDTVSLPCGCSKVSTAFKHRTFEMLSKNCRLVWIAWILRVGLGLAWGWLGVVWVLAGLIELRLRHLGRFDFRKANMRLWIVWERDRPCVLQKDRSCELCLNCQGSEIKWNLLAEPKEHWALH